MAPTHGFSKDQVASFQDVFKQFDTDGSGSISTSELSSALKLLKVEATDKQVADMLKSYDADGNGSLEFDEFVDMLWHLQNGPNEKEIRAEMFSMFDESFNGFITVDDLRSVFKSAAAEGSGGFSVPSDVVLRGMIEAADTDGDGKLSRAEFFALLDALDASKA